MDQRKRTVTGFHKKCLSKANPLVLLVAIMKAQCPSGVAGPSHLPRSKKGPDTLFFEDFESSSPLSAWKGKNGASKPHSAAITVDPDPSRKHVLHITKCTGGGDAFSAATMECTLAKPCVVEYDHKGRIWQGFANGFPGSHTWSATPKAYTGSHATTVHDNHHWQHIEYIFPVKAKGGTTHVHGSSVAVSKEHFMVEGHDADCEKTCGPQFVHAVSHVCSVYCWHSLLDHKLISVFLGRYIDNIMVSKASPQRFCDDVDKTSYEKICAQLEGEWHKSIKMTDYVALPVCNVLVNTNGETCEQYCKSQGLMCRHGQDNVGVSCKLQNQAHPGANNGCHQKWGNQVCGCSQTH